MSQKHIYIGLLAAIVVAVIIFAANRPEPVVQVNEDSIVKRVLTEVKELLNLGAIPGSTVQGTEFTVGGQTTFSAKHNWSTEATTGVVCQIKGPSASSTLTHLGAFGASPLNSAGNLKVYVASTTINLSAADGGLATTTGLEILSQDLANNVTLQVVATSSIYDSTKLTGYSNPFIPPNSVFIFDASSATSSVGRHHRTSSCEVETILQ